jgi:hypothetical protein
MPGLYLNPAPDELLNGRLNLQRRFTLGLRRRPGKVAQDQRAKSRTEIRAAAKLRVRRSRLASFGGANSMAR